ncbi:MAG TPA: aldo/keto reductase [Thermoflexales bacterium]|nr:aldo/keto reductase [Thermoflexales bacterium]
MMKTRLFGKTGAQVGEIGLGCWQLGGADWGTLDDKTAHDLLYEAVDNGITFFDTADVYGDGRSEQLLGDFFQRNPRPVFIATKLGRGAMYPDQYTEENVRKATEESLRRLKRDTLDLTQLHCVPGKILEQGDVFVWLDKLQRQGKIRHWGVSVESVDEALICMAQPNLASLQIIFNIFRQKPIKTLFSRAKSQNIGLIARLPLASGLLGGKLHRNQKFSPSDHRYYNRNGEHFNVGETFAGLPFETGLDLVATLEDQLQHGMTLAQMALRWILDYDAISVVIPGASKPGQISETIKASSFKPLDADFHDWLADFYAERVSTNIRGPY